MVVSYRVSPSPAINASCSLKGYRRGDVHRTSGKTNSNLNVLKRSSQVASFGFVPVGGVDEIYSSGSFLASVVKRNGVSGVRSTVSSTVCR